MCIIFHEIKTPLNDLPTLGNFTATKSTYRFSSHAIHLSANYANYVTRSALSRKQIHIRKRSYSSKS